MITVTLLIVYLGQVVLSLETLLPLLLFVIVGHSCCANLNSVLFIFVETLLADVLHGHGGHASAEEGVLVHGDHVFVA